jgi:hypothetical protein
MDEGAGNGAGREMEGRGGREVEGREGGGKGPTIASAISFISRKRDSSCM